MAMLITPGHNGPGQAGLLGNFLAGKAVGHGVAPQLAEGGHVLVGGHQFHRANLIAQVYVFKEEVHAVSHCLRYSREA